MWALQRCPQETMPMKFESVWFYRYYPFDIRFRFLKFQISIGRDQLKVEIRKKTHEKIQNRLKTASI